MEYTIVRLQFLRRGCWWCQLVPDIGHLYTMGDTITLLRELYSNDDTTKKKMTGRICPNRFSITGPLLSNNHSTTVLITE